MRLVAVFVALGAVAVAVGAFWPQIKTRLPAQLTALISGPALDTTQLLVPPQKMDSVSRDSLRRDTSSADSALLRAGIGVRDSAANKPATPPLQIANAADSSTAARYSIYVAQANTREAAMPDARTKALPAVAMSPVPEGTEQWFRVTVGASTSRSGAEAQLAKLRSDKIIGAGSILSVPFALRLETGVPLGAVSARLAEFARRGLMPYALQQADGSATLYTGAFETPVQATSLADSLRALGITPVLAYRTGRTF